MIADKNEGFVEFDVNIRSANILPVGSQFEVSIKKLNYVANGTNDTESYVGVPSATARFTK